MLVDKLLFGKGEEAPSWVVSLTLFPIYAKILELDPHLKAALIKNLKGFANNKTFQHLNSSSEIYEKPFIEGFINSEIEKLKTELSHGGEKKMKFGGYKENSNIFYIIFCPSHYYPGCCFTNDEEKNDLVCCDHCGNNNLIL